MKIQDKNGLRDATAEEIAENNEVSKLINAKQKAKIDEAKERLLINVLDTAEPAVKKAKPKRTLIVILSFIFGLILAIPYTLYLDRRKS